MQRTARLVLRRINKQGKRVRTKVKVQRITLGGFLALVRMLAPKVAAAMGAAGRGLTYEELLPICGTKETIAFFADLVCAGRPVGFLKKWCPGHVIGSPEGLLERENVQGLLEASRAVEGDGQWTRYINTINRPAAEPAAKGKRARGGGLSADAEMIARLYHVTPWQVEQIPLADFLNLCDTLNVAMESAEVESEGYDPTLDPEAEPSPLPKRSVH